MPTTTISTASDYVNNNTDRAGNENLTKFFAFNQNPYLDPALSGFSFVFVTKPSLFISVDNPSDTTTNDYLAYQNMCVDPKFSIFITSENSNTNDVLIARQLSYLKNSKVSSLFLPIFTNSAKGFNPGDVSIEGSGYYTTKEGYSYNLPTNITQSQAAGEITIPVTETANLDFTKMLQIWVNYIANITNGTFSANPEMIKQNMIDYMCSIYFFNLAPDGQTIKYWCRYTGCYPTTIPYSAQNYQKGSIEQVQFDIPFRYTFKTDMDPRILEDFNMVSLQLVNTDVSSFNYSSFLKDAVTEEDNGYISYTNKNSLLSKTRLFNDRPTDINDSARDPLVYFEPERVTNTVAGTIPGSFKLTFGANSLSNSFYKSLLKDVDSSAYDYESLLASI